MYMWEPDTHLDWGLSIYNKKIFVAAMTCISYNLFYNFLRLFIIL